MVNDGRRQFEQCQFVAKIIHSLCSTIRENQPNAVIDSMIKIYIAACQLLPTLVSVAVCRQIKSDDIIGM